MKIAFVGQKGIPATYGGIEKYVDILSRRLAARGHAVTVYCRPHYTKMAGIYEGVRIRRLPSIATKHLDALSHTLVSSVDTLMEDYDIINYQAVGPSSLSFIPRFLGRAKIVATIHALDYERKKWGPLAQKIFRYAEYPAIAAPHAVVTISHELRRFLESKYDREFKTIYAGVQEPVFREPEKIRKYGLARGNFILYLSRLVPEKGCHYLIEAFKNLPTDKKLFIAGGGDFAEDYIRDLRKNESDRIIFGGHVPVDELEELYSNAYLYVLPSETEGQPETVTRALCYGCPVLVSDIPAALEVIGPHGHTFRNADVADLRGKLTQLLAQPEQLAAGAEERKKYAQATFSWDRAVDEFEKLYEEMLRV